MDSTTRKTPSRFSSRGLLAASLALVLAAAPALGQAQGRGHWHGGGGYHGWHGGGWGWGPAFGVALGIDLALASRYPYGYYDYPRTVIVEPAPTYYERRVVVPEVAPAPSHSAPDPVIYPRNGQSAAQTETDMRDCNSWATRQPRAMADASVFQRATAACMDGRGYSIR